MKEKMSRWGIGPIFAFLSIGYGMMMIAISRYYMPVFRIDFVPYGLMKPNVSQSRAVLRKKITCRGDGV